ncbi:MAG: helicase [Xanthobacteraceae bacterium]|nr:helicase [Xanthobacteraceae bacterium]
MTLAAYRELCASKKPQPLLNGLAKVPALNPTLFPHQAHGVDFALRTGRAGLFYDTGLGKTAMMLEWGHQIVRETNKPVMMLAPLAVGSQHVREAERIGIEAKVSRFGTAPDKPCIAITNYERLEKFDPAEFGGIILDESSILKSFTGKTTRKLIETFNGYRFRLAGTATPAPNDHTELGQHSEFLGVMPSSEMLSRFFITDQAEMGRYRLKKPAIRPFWDWVASWARCVAKPSDLGFSDEGFVLPPLNVQRHVIVADRSIAAGEEKDGQGRLFRIPDRSATAIHKEKRMTIERRAAKVAELVAGMGDDPCVIWVDTDYEAEAVRAAIPTCFEVHGKMHADAKEGKLDAFSRGEIQILLTKPSIAGFGLNWQHCHNTIFAGVNFSYESYYQALRRFWRFGQKKPVNAHIVCADTELEIASVVDRKSGDHENMKREMSAAMRRAANPKEVFESYHPEKEASLPSWL